jgi:hypothetical protein
MKSRTLFDIPDAWRYNIDGQVRRVHAGEPIVSPFRRNLLVSGLVGLFLCGFLTAVAISLVASGVLRPPLPYPGVTLIFIVVFGAFSIAEIPMMVFAMHRLVIERKGNYAVVLGLNGLYVSFAGVYALPVILFTGSIGGGLALSALGIVRLAASLLRVREPANADQGGGPDEARKQ